MKKLLIGLMIVASLGTAACSSEADVASENVSRAAEAFEVNRRIVFFNGITDTYLLSIEGRCSIEAGSHTGVSGSLEVTCKTEDEKYIKHFLGLSDNVSYFVEQMEAIDVSVYHYRVFFRPQTILPDIDTEVGR